MIVLGITGSVGTGKSTVARLFEAQGAARLDADAIVHALMRPRTAAWREIRRSFGPGVIAAGGRIDRAALARLVFAQPKARKRLERILHPRVFREIHRQVRRLRQQGRKAIVVVEIPLLFEARAQRLVDGIVVVTAPRAVQEARLRRHYGWRPQEIRQRVAAQWALPAKVALADVVIDNGRRVADTRRQVKDVWNKLRPRNNRKPSSTSQRSKR